MTSKKLCHKIVTCGAILKAYMKSYIPLVTAAIFFLANLYLHKVLARSMSCLTSFAWAY